MTTNQDMIGREDINDLQAILAVTNTEGRLLGLLCLKASGLGFCSDADVTSRTDPA